MIERIFIKNIALIDNIFIEFKEGFNVLTGESGSGKSLIAGAIALLRGSKGNPSLIRTGEEQAEVSGVFSITENLDKELLKLLDEKGISPEEGELILRRTIKLNGRGAITAQSIPISRSELSLLSSYLFDIHGQHEQHTLMSSDRQRSLLDNFSDIEEDLLKFSALFAETGKMKKQFSAFEMSEKERLREIDILKFSVNEISEASLKLGEDEELQKEHKKLADHEKLFRLADETYENLSDGILKIKTASNSLKGASYIDEKLMPHAERLSNTFFELEDIAEMLRDYIGKDSFNPERLAVCEERLSVIHKLQKKYGHSIAEILEYFKESQERLFSLENLDIDKEELRKGIKIKEDEISQQANSISAAREKNSSVLEKQIEEVLKKLGMEEASFAVQVSRKKNEAEKSVCGQYGIDTVDFMISPNIGEPLKPIEQIASGGELSRIMLAVKSVLSKNDPVDSMLFDEIDSGIGGGIAVSLGYYLQKLSQSKQIISITHLASIAVYADNHIQVRKVTEKQRTFTKAEKVHGESRVAEIARMLSGDQSGEVSLEHARVLLKKMKVN